MIPYWQKLKDPRWQRKRLEILQRDGFACQHCGDKESELHVHHTIYTPKTEPWEHESESLITLCTTCHGDVEMIKKEIGLQLKYAAVRCLYCEIAELISGGLDSEINIAVQKIKYDCLNPDGVEK